MNVRIWFDAANNGWCYERDGVTRRGFSDFTDAYHASRPESQPVNRPVVEPVAIAADPGVLL